jgi:site-specific recombinase XerD
MNEIEAFLAMLQEKGRSPRTIQVYRAALANLDRFLGRQKCAGLAETFPKHFVRWQKHLVRTKCSAATINLFSRVAHSLLEWLVDSDRLFFNPASSLERPAPGRTLGRCPSATDMKRLLDGVSGDSPIDQRDRALLELAYATGARCEEISQIDLTAVDMGRRTLLVTGKGGDQRVIPLTRAAASAIAAYLKAPRETLLRGRTEQPALFLSQRNGRRLATFAIAGVVRRRGAKVGLVVSPHDFRRAFATHLLQGGASLAHLKDLLGHKDYSHLKAYLRLAPTDFLTAVRNSPLNQ